MAPDLHSAQSAQTPARDTRLTDTTPPNPPITATSGDHPTTDQRFVRHPLLCPYHHRLHHRGVITITGPADHLLVTDSDGQPLNPGSLARPPTTPPPDVPPDPGPTGERADWWWYNPYQPQPPPTNN